MFVRESSSELSSLSLPRCSSPASVICVDSRSSIVSPASPQICRSPASFTPVPRKYKHLRLVNPSRCSNPRPVTRVSEKLEPVEFRKGLQVHQAGVTDLGCTQVKLA